MRCLGRVLVKVVFSAQTGGANSLTAGVKKKAYIVKSTPHSPTAYFFNSYFSFMHILVSNLSIDVINDDLIQLFSTYGEVSFSAVVRDKKNGRSKGRAFIEMPFEAQGEQAISALNGALLDGHEISVQKIEAKAGEFNN